MPETGPIILAKWYICQLMMNWTSAAEGKTLVELNDRQVLLAWSNINSLGKAVVSLDTGKEFMKTFAG